MRWLFAYLHLIALPIGAAALITRAMALRHLQPGDSPRRAIAADNWWSAAAVLWIATGLTRYLTDFEKGTAYYNDNAIFLVKMALLGVILALEVPCAITLVKWRIATKRGRALDLAKAPGLSRLNYVQAALAAAMVACATAMARGF